MKVIVISPLYQLYEFDVIDGSYVADFFNSKVIFSVNENKNKPFLIEDYIEKTLARDYEENLIANLSKKAINSSAYSASSVNELISLSPLKMGAVALIDFLQCKAFSFSSIRLAEVSNTRLESMLWPGTHNEKEYHKKIIKDYIYLLENNVLSFSGTTDSHEFNIFPSKILEALKNKLNGKSTEIKDFLPQFSMHGFMIKSNWVINEKTFFERGPTQSSSGVEINFLIANHLSALGFELPIDILNQFSRAINEVQKSDENKILLNTYLKELMIHLERRELSKSPALNPGANNSNIIKLKNKL